MPIIISSNRGQIVIPKVVRNELGITPGKKLLIKSEKDKAVLIPLPDDPVEHFCGIFQQGPSLTKALLSERQKERERETKTNSG